MKCRFYLQSAEGRPEDLGSFDFENENEARRAARERLDASPEATSIDVWSHRGELFRIERDVSGAKT